MAFLPAGPERAVLPMPFQKTRHFIDMEGTHVAAQEMPKQMQGSISDRVGRSQYVEFHAPHIPFDPAVPELFRTGRGKAFQFRIPEAKVQFERKGNTRIEVIAFPLP